MCLKTRLYQALIGPVQATGFAGGPDYFRTGVLFRSLSPADCHNVVRDSLVDNVVEPIGVQQVCMAAPADNWGGWCHRHSGNSSVECESPDPQPCPAGIPPLEFQDRIPNGR